jgi:predicted SAM-dependent methyltransferase
MAPGTALTLRLKRVEHPAGRLALLWLRSLPHRLARGHLVRRRRVRRYLAGTSSPRLQIGSGPQSIPGWLNSDLIAGDIYLDLQRPLPFEDRSFAYVFGEHVIEHLPERDGAALLAELHRVLRPGGVLRLTTPDLRKIIAIYEDRNPVIGREEYVRFLDLETGKRHERPCQVLNDYLRLWGHRYVYDDEDLMAKLRLAGFTEVVRREAGESEHEALRGLERHGGEAWVNRAEAMSLEASRGTS